MLVDFTVKNFALFRDETTLLAEAGERLRKYKETNTFANLKVLGIMQELTINHIHAVTN
ncbi:hypothetical protein [Lactobacillus sp. LL6]|uniref:hypothetical protein n=1 Tax=Lactobacillus sp. LL6 TaxID=2596827 RepID=UPI0016436A27|nr:hypothetical protein [Lactobacillus sp. LL6]